MSKVFNGIVIFDIDGCLADDTNRLGKAPTTAQVEEFGGSEAWRAYHASSASDTVNATGARALENAREFGMYIHFITGRPAYRAAQTMDWLLKMFGLELGVHYSIDHRPNGDVTDTVSFKRNVASQLIGRVGLSGGKVVRAFDDREDIVQAYRDLGIDAHVIDLDQERSIPLFSKVEEGVNEPNGRAPMGATDVDGYQRGLSLLTGESRLQPQEATPGAGFDPSREAQGPGFVGDTQSLHHGESHGRSSESAIPSHGRPYLLHDPDYPVLANLARAAETFEERAKVHGRNDVMYGQVMAILFPDGMSVKTADDHRLAMFVMHVVGKLTRLAATGFTNTDSAHDAITYMAMVEATMDKGRVV